MKEYVKGLISIIIPVYNASAVIHKCLEAINRQTYRKLEVLFVDDCCTDDSMDKLNDFLRRNNTDLKIKCIHHERNCGVAAARNTGLDNATGEYIYYLDADDFMEDNTIELMYREAEKSQADITGCEWYLSFQKNERHMIQADANNGDELFVKMARGVIRWNLWLFLVRRSLYEQNSIRFMEGMNMGEDMMVMMKLALCSGKIVIMHTPLYHYVQTKSDSLTKTWSKGYQQQIDANVKEVENYININRNDKGLKTELDYLKLNIKLPLLISLSSSDYEKWQNWFPEANTNIMGNKDISLRTRLLQFAASKHLYGLIKLYNLLAIKVVYGILYK